ncbi:MAG TPA: hypothetical protein VM260_25395 [Pirellula sp.]|nr:hypothetical protein [Pirellula sp.]
MLIDCHNHIGTDLLFYLHGDFPYAQQLVQMQQESRPLGVTHWIVFPFVSYAAMDHSCRYDKACLDRVKELPNAWFDCSAHCIHCNCAVDDLPNIAPRSIRFDTDYSNPGRVIADLAAAYPKKFLWGSDSPFYSYAAKIDGEIVRLISTYQREVEALKQSPPKVVNQIANVNTRDFLKLPDENILA